MNIYRRKKRWKIILGLMAIVIVSVSLWYSNILARQISQDEIRNITIWADAIRSRAQLVYNTQLFFEQIKAEERKRVELLAEAYKRIGVTDDSDELDFLLKVISSNTTIPFVFTDSNGTIILAGNVEEDVEKAAILEGDLLREFTQYEPVIISYLGFQAYVYYKESKTFTQLREYLEYLERSFISEVVANSASVPVIITDVSQRHIVAEGNIDKAISRDNDAMIKLVQEMASENRPIEIQFSEGRERLIFYKSSYLLTQLKYYPYFQFGVIAVFIGIAYLLFSTARRSEQNQVWAGLAKETAHQLGTPLSAIMAWIEILKMKGVDAETTSEMEKDVERLQIITERFSKIGSEARLLPVNIIDEIEKTVSYLQTRTSKKIKLKTSLPENRDIIVPLNTQLFGWVIENLWKNSTDAMSGNGTIEIILIDDNRHVSIDFRDTGKGISKSSFSNVFNPGFTSKQRGWGLGLSLARRIIEDYHRGKIFIKSSELGKGTVFRIVLRK